MKPWWPQAQLLAGQAILPKLHAYLAVAYSARPAVIQLCHANDLCKCHQLTILAHSAHTAGKKKPNPKFDVTFLLVKQHLHYIYKHTGKTLLLVGKTHVFAFMSPKVVLHALCAYLELQALILHAGDNSRRAACDARNDARVRFLACSTAPISTRAGKHYLSTNKAVHRCNACALLSKHVQLL